MDPECSASIRLGPEACFFDADTAEADSEQGRGECLAGALQLFVVYSL